MLFETNIHGCICKTKIGGCASNEYYWRNQLGCEVCSNTSRRSKNVDIDETTRELKFAEEIQTILTNNANNLYWEPIDLRSDTDYQLENAVVRGYENGCNLYIGKAYLEGEWKIGTVFFKENFHKGLHIQDRFGKSHIILNFDILKHYANC